MADLFTLQADERQVVAGLEAFTDDLRARLVPSIQRITDDLLGRVIAAEPDRTGSLRGATESFLSQGADFIHGGVAIDPEHGEPFNIKAGALEYGAHKLTSVSGHTRTVAQIFGAAIAPRAEVVSPYTRRPNIDEMRFLRGPLQTAQDQLSGAVEAAAGEAAKAFSE